MNWKNLLFWILSLLAAILLLWNIFGNSPSEFITLITIIFAMVVKMWTLSDRQIKSEMRMKEGFNKIKDDMDLIKKKLKV
ncbi:hypothetical protein J4402_04155 [Candidatus Pacearchaeota archaeon]|nr:hypothetical protein [Candidatus Pacearchaeota archaeon]